jgi:hypothetical protein
MDRPILVFVVVARWSKDLVIFITFEIFYYCCIMNRLVKFSQKRRGSYNLIFHTRI